jgi:hypothetical protein
MPYVLQKDVKCENLKFLIDIFPITHDKNYRSFNRTFYPISLPMNQSFISIFKSCIYGFIYY